MSDVKIYYKQNRQLYLLKGEDEYEIQVKKCFPWTHPLEYLSLRDVEDSEVYLVENLTQLDAESRKNLASYLDKSDYIHEIVKVVDVIEDVELRNYKIATKGGERSIQTRLDDWPSLQDDGGVIIQDLNGDLFRIPTPETLDENSRELLSTYIS